MTEAQSQAVLTMLEYTARQVVELRKEVSELRRRIRTPRKTEPNSVKLQRARRQIQKP